ncbi:MAG: hypothetical protein Q9219_002846 [cf. Caloplaca sp. 3 TL-2023]
MKLRNREVSSPSLPPPSRKSRRTPAAAPQAAPKPQGVTKGTKKKKEKKGQPTIPTATKKGRPRKISKEVAESRTRAWVQDHGPDTRSNEETIPESSSAATTSRPNSRYRGHGVSPEPGFRVSIAPPRRSSQRTQDPLRPHPAGVQKWGRYLLPTFGRPYWRTRNNVPTLYLPLEVDLNEEVRIMREAAAHGQDQAAQYQKFVRGLREQDFRGLHDDLAGEVMDYLDGVHDAAQGQQEPTRERSGERYAGENEEQRERLGTPFQAEVYTEPVDERGNSPSGPTHSRLTPPPPAPPTIAPDPPLVEGRLETSHVNYEPMPYDAPVDAAITGPPEPGDGLSNLNPEFVGFMRSKHGYEEGWVGRKPLGKGAMGVAGMWEKRDADGNVIDVRVLE